MSALDFLSGQVLRSTAGTIYTGAKAYYWSDAGATTPLTVYTDAGLSSAHPNPVVADGTTGVFAAIFIQARRYWRTVTDSAGVSLPQFNIGPIDHPTLFASAAAPSPTAALMRYYNTTDGFVYRRNAANSAWINEGAVDSLINAATVTETLAGMETGKATTPDSVAGLWQRGADITAASTLSLPAGGGGVFNLTGGVTTITGISSASGGRSVKLRMNAAHPLTHNGTSFILPGGASLTAASGDVFEFTNEAATDGTGSNWRCTNIEKASGSPVNITDQIAAKSDQETATNLTKAVTPGRQYNHPGHPKAYLHFNGSGTPAASSSFKMSTTIADNGVGEYTLTLTDTMPDTNYLIFGFCNSVTAGTGGFVSRDTGDTKTTTTFKIRCRRSDTGGAIDSTEISVFVFSPTLP